VETVGKVIIFFVGMWVLVAGMYGLVVHDNKVGWWFIIVGCVVLLGRVFLDEDNDDSSNMG
jgi:hypothetical protein